MHTKLLLHKILFVLYQENTFFLCFFIVLANCILLLVCILDSCCI